MQPSVEILDHIFSFLVSHRETLIACSKDPVLSPIVERHLYQHVIIHNGQTDSDDAFTPHHIFKLVSENPHILYHVRILHLRFESEYLSDEFAHTLSMFPVLERIMVQTTEDQTDLPDAFQAALEDLLSLPTIKEVQLSGGDRIPFSVLDNCKNLRNLSFSFSGISTRLGGQSRASTLPQLHSLRSLTSSVSWSLLAWAKLHINELRLLKYVLLYVEDLSELLEVCSETLNILDIQLENTGYSSDYTFRTGEIEMIPLPELSPVPSNLQQLTIRTAVHLVYHHHRLLYCGSWLPPAAEIIKLFIRVSPPRHLVLDINISLSTFCDFTRIDFSPLAILGPASLSIPRIDLYIHTGVFPSALTRARLLSSLEDHEDIVRMIQQGVLVIHSEKTAPDV